MIFVLTLDLITYSLRFFPQMLYQPRMNGVYCTIIKHPSSKKMLITARKRSLRRLCFYRCLSVHTGGGGHAWLLGGACVVFLGACVVFWGACMVFLGFVHGFSGVCVCVFFGGCVCFFSGGPAWFLGGHAWLPEGGCAWLPVGGSCIGYDEIRSMSGRYASYWNAFLC